MLTGAAILAIGKRVLFFAIPIPVALILAAWAWVAIDKSSAVRKAVDKAVTEIVDGAELEAERARSAALQKILAERERQAEADREALRDFAEKLEQAETENGNLADALALIENQPVDPGCRVDRTLLDRLRERQGGTARGG